MADRDINLRMGTSLKPGGDAAFKNLSAGAKSFGKESDSACKIARTGVDKLMSSVSRLGVRFKEVGVDGVKSLKQITAAAKQTEQALASAGKFKIGVDPGRLNVRAGGGGGIGGELAGMAGLPTNIATLGGAFAALTASIRAADGALKIYSQSFYRGQFHAGQTIDQIQHQIQQHTPDIISTPLGEMSRRKIHTGLDFVSGGLASIMFGQPGGSAEDTTSSNLRKARTQSLQETAETARFRERQFTMRESRLRPLGMERAELGALGKFGYSSAGASFGIEQQTRQRLMNSFWRAGRTPGYSREAEMSDLGLRLHSDAALRSHSIEAVRLQNIQGAKTGHAAQVEAAAKQAVLLQQREVGHAHDAVHAAKGTEGEGNARLQLEQQLVTLREKQQQLAEATEKSLELQRETTQKTRDLNDQQLRIRQSYSASIAQERQAEQAKQQGQREELGLLHPQKLRTIVGLQRKLAMGRAPTMSEIGFMRSAPGDVFRNSLQKIAQDRAGGGMTGAMIQEIQKNSGMGARLEELGRLQVKADANVNVNIDLNKAILEQLARQVVPVIRNIEGDLKNQTQTALDQFHNRQMANNRAMNR